MERVFGILLFIVVTASGVCCARAESDTLDIEGVTHKNWFDKVLDSPLVDFVIGVSPFDSAYVYQPEQCWTVRPNVGFSGAKVFLSGVDHGKSYSVSMQTDYKPTVAADVSYRTLSLSLDFTPLLRLSSDKDKDMILGFDCNGSKFGMGLSYSHVTSYHGGYGWQRGGGQEINVSDFYIGKSTTAFRLWRLYGSYVLSNDRYSRPAAFKQRQIQLRSAGSPIVTVEGRWALVRLHADSLKVNYRKSQFLVGFGYAYNFVLPEDWVVSLYAVPQLGVYTNIVFHNRKVTSEAENWQKVDCRNPFLNFSFSGTLSVQRNIKKKIFFGFMGYFSSDRSGRKSHIAVSNISYSAEAFWGVRF